MTAENRTHYWVGLVALVGLMTAMTPISAMSAADRTRKCSRLFGPSLSTEAKAWLASSHVEFRSKQEQLERRWLKDHTRYDAYLDRRLLKITRSDKVILFDVESLGSVRPSDKTWEWAWFNPNHPFDHRRTRNKLTEVARKYRLPYLDVGIVVMPDSNIPWCLSAIALKATGLMGAYVAEGDDLQVFLLLTNPRVTAP